MSHWEDVFPQNHLLSAMPYLAFEVLRPSLEPIVLPVGSVLATATTPILHLHFLCDGIATSQGPSATAILGREGMSGEAVIGGTSYSPYDTVMQVAGSSLRISTVDLMEAMAGSVPLKVFLERYAQVRLSERDQSRALAARHSRLERTARWLLMCHDRVDGDLLPVSRTLLHLLVGGPLESVGEILDRFVANQSIRSTPGWIEIRNREHLRRLAGSAYGAIEEQYDSFLGFFR